MSRPAKNSIPELITRFLALHEGKNNSEVARATGLDQSLIARWRRGQTPERLQEGTRKRLVALVGSAEGARRIADAGDPELRNYALSTLRMLQRQAQAIVDNAVEAQRVLGGDVIAPGVGVTPSIDAAEEMAAVLGQLTPEAAAAAPKKKRPA